eukprot:8966911-Pyramimonas_sp.AAC.1
MAKSSNSTATPRALLAAIRDCPEKGPHETAGVCLMRRTSAPAGSSAPAGIDAGQVQTQKLSERASSI